MDSKAIEAWNERAFEALCEAADLVARLASQGTPSPALVALGTSLQSSIDELRQSQCTGTYLAVLGRKLTRAERAALHATQDFCEANRGRWVDVREIFPAHNNQDNARRRTISRLIREGAMVAYEIEVDGHGQLRSPLAPHVHTRDCYDDPGPGHGSPSLICFRENQTP